MPQKLLLSLLLLGLLLSCRNIFNPDGSTDPKDLSPEALVDYGEQLYARQHFTDAHSVFNLALKKDSTLSLAYYGLIKSTLRVHNVNPLSLAKLAVTSTDSTESKKPIEKVSELFDSGFLSDISGFKEMNKIMFEFFRRDSINHYYKLSTQGNTGKELDSIDQLNLLQFKESFFTKPSYPESSFPIMDEIIIREDLALSYELSQIITTMSSVRALVGDNEESSAEIQAILKGDKKVSELTAFKEAVNDSIKGEEHNALIDEIASGSSEINLSPDLLGIETKNDTGNVSLEEEIDKLGQSILFYKVADRKDNDGDGCIDEELYDGIDNDLDGIIDEDVRRVADDEFDNDRDGVIDNNFERFSVIDSLLYYVKGNDKYMRNYYYSDDSVRILVHLDSNFKTYSLQWRRDSIGGCW